MLVVHRSLRQILLFISLLLAISAIGLTDRLDENELKDPLREFKKATVAIGRSNQQSLDGTGIPSMTVESAGFLYAYIPSRFTRRNPESNEKGSDYVWTPIWVVTCHHSIRGNSVPMVRLDAKSGRTVTYEIPAIQWYAHPTEDVAVARLRFTEFGERPTRSDWDKIRDTDLITLGRSSSALRQELAVMGFYEYTPVAMIGFPMGRIDGGKRNYPLVRSGRIAQIQGYFDEDPAYRSFLVDGSVFWGNSGGPVVIPAGTRNLKGDRLLSDSILIGLVAHFKSLNKRISRYGETISQNLDLTGVVTMDSVHEVIDLAYADEFPRSPVQ